MNTSTPINASTDSDRAMHVAHYDKYLAYAAHLHVSFASASELPHIVEAVRNGDLWLNSIPLRRWDAYHGFYAPNARGLEIGGWSYANTVCTAKCAALVAALRVILGDSVPLSTGEEIQTAIESLHSEGNQ